MDLYTQTAKEEIVQRTSELLETNGRLLAVLVSIITVEFLMLLNLDSRKYK